MNCCFFSLNKGSPSRVSKQQNGKALQFEIFFCIRLASHIYYMLTLVLTQKCVFDGNVQVLFVQPVINSRVYINCVQTSSFKALASQSEVVTLLIIDTHHLAVKRKCYSMIHCVCSLVLLAKEEEE